MPTLASTCLKQKVCYNNLQYSVSLYGTQKRPKLHML